MLCEATVWQQSGRSGESVISLDYLKTGKASYATKWFSYCFRYFLHRVWRQNYDASARNYSRRVFSVFDRNFWASQSRSLITVAIALCRKPAIWKLNCRSWAKSQLIVSSIKILNSRFTRIAKQNSHMTRRELKGTRMFVAVTTRRRLASNSSSSTEGFSLSSLIFLTVFHYPLGHDRHCVGNHYWAKRQMRRFPIRVSYACENSVDNQTLMQASLAVFSDRLLSRSVDSLRISGENEKFKFFRPRRRRLMRHTFRLDRARMRARKSFPLKLPSIALINHVRVASETNGSALERHEWVM